MMKNEPTRLSIPLLRHLPSAGLIAAAICIHFLVPFALSAQDGNPRHPAVVHFEEVGTLEGVNTGVIWPLGDVDADGLADFAVQVGLDTSSGTWRTPAEV